MQLRLFEETSNEAHSHLNALMRGDDLRGKLKAIELWLKCGARAYGGNGQMVTPEEIPWADIAFRSTDFTLRRYLEDKAAGCELHYFETLDRRAPPPTDE